MKKYNFYSLFLLTVLSLSMLFFSCSRSCKKAVLDYIPGFSKNKSVEGEEKIEKDQSALQNIVFRFKEKDYDGKINLDDLVIYVDLNGENPDASIMLEKWELIPKYNTFEYELKAKKDIDGIINAIAIEKLESPIITYQVLFQKENKTAKQDKTKKEVVKITEKEQKEQIKLPVIEKIELRDTQGNTANVTIQKGKILVLNGKKGENYQIIELGLSDFMASAKLNIGDYWQIGEENVISEGNNQNIYVLSAKSVPSKPKTVVKKKKSLTLK